MSQFFSIHPETPQIRLIHQAVEILNRGGVIAYPTDSAYALGCLLDNKSGVERIKGIRRLPEAHNFTLICKDLSELSRYARVDNLAYRQIKHATPGPYTFVFEASREVPRRIMNPKRKTIGLRVPDNAIAQALLNELDAPLMSVTLIMPGDDYPLSDPYDIRTTLEHQVDLVIDGGYCGLEPTTVIDMSGDEIVLLRQGLGSSDDFI
ncbi:MAG: threonylcarbamoyl-AMP synthase [Luminiphilus sp.]|nr:threonylcarbamoyl-AMP synthase [Luminiphilus sp.]